MWRQRSMLIPCQVPSSALIAKGGATFVPMTSSRVSDGPGVWARACGAWASTATRATATITVQIPINAPPFWPSLLHHGRLWVWLSAHLLCCGSARRSNQVPVCTQACECRSLAFSNGKGRNCRVVIQSINDPSTPLAYLSVLKSTICLVSAFAQYHLGNASVLPTA